MSNKRLLVLLNPVAGKGKAKNKVFEMVDIFDRHGYSTTVVPTRPGDGISKQITEEAPHHDTIVIIGGDGTLNHAVNGMLKNGVDLPVGYIPLGSTNDFGNSLGLSANVHTACEKIAQGEGKPIDVGKFGERYFIYIAATGMFTEASYATSQQMKNALGHSAYIMKGITTISPAHISRYTVETPEGTVDGEFIYGSVSNSLRAGGVFKLPKDMVEFDDGSFELILAAAPKNIIDGTSLMNGIVRSDINNRNFTVRKGDRFVFRFEKPHGWTLDGEKGEEVLECEITVAKRALNLIRD